MIANHVVPVMQTTDTSVPSSIDLAKEEALLQKEESLRTKHYHAVAVIDAHPVTATSRGAMSGSPARKSRRRGRVASLPKLQRDMVNRMLWNGVPYKNIVAALHDEGFTLIERNISN